MTYEEIFLLKSYVVLSKSGGAAAPPFPPPIILAAVVQMLRLHLLFQSINHHSLQSQ